MIAARTTAGLFAANLVFASGDVVPAYYYITQGSLCGFPVRQLLPSPFSLLPSPFSLLPSPSFPTARISLARALPYWGGPGGQHDLEYDGPRSIPHVPSLVRHIALLDAD